MRVYAIWNFEIDFLSPLFLKCLKGESFHLKMAGDNIDQFSVNEIWWANYLIDVLGSISSYQSMPFIVGPYS